MRLRASRKGLSLIEVLVSMAIFLMALTALVHLVNTSSQLAGEGHRRSHASALCRAKMAELSAGALPLQGQGAAPFDDDPDYRYTLDVEPGVTQGLYNVTVKVTYRPDDTFPITVTMSRMILDPKVTGSTQDVPTAPAESGAEAESSSSSSTTPSTGSTSGGTTTPATGGTTTPSTGGASSSTKGGKG